MFRLQPVVEPNRQVRDPEEMPRTATAMEQLPAVLNRLPETGSTFDLEETDHRPSPTAIGRAVHQHRFVRGKEIRIDSDKDILRNRRSEVVLNWPMNHDEAQPAIALEQAPGNARIVLKLVLVKEAENSANAEFLRLRTPTLRLPKTAFASMTPIITTECDTCCHLVEEVMQSPTPV